MAYYIPRIAGFEQMTVSEIYGWAPLHFLMAEGLNLLIRDPAITIKILAASLQGFLGISIYLWCRKSFGSRNGALFAAMVTSFYFPVLRLAWDLQRNVLGLALMFLTLWLVDKKSNLSVIAGGLTALSHQLVAPLLGVILFFKGRKNEKALYSLVVTSAIWLSVILVAWGPEAGGHVIGAAIGETRALFPTSLEALQLFIFLSIPILPFLLFLRRNFNMKNRSEMLVFLFTCLALSFLSGFISSRYAIMATIPLTVLISSWVLEKGKKASLALGLVVGIFAFSYSAMPTSEPAPYFQPPISWDESFKYTVPTSLQQNTVPLQEVPNARKLVRTAGNLANEEERLIVNRVFLSYAVLEGVSRDEIYFTNTESSWIPEDTAPRPDGPRGYFIWWVPEKGWYEIERLPRSHEVIQTEGSLALYRFDLKTLFKGGR